VCCLHIHRGGRGRVGSLRRSSHLLLRRKGRVVADPLVNRQTDGERNALLDGLAVLLRVVDRADEAEEDLLGGGHDGEGGFVGDNEGEEKVEGGIGDAGRLGVLGDDGGVAEGGVLVGVRGDDLRGVGGLATFSMGGRGRCTVWEQEQVAQNMVLVLDDWGQRMPAMSVAILHSSSPPPRSRSREGQRVRP